MGSVMYDYVETVKSKGRLYNYYRRNWIRHKRLPDEINTIEFAAAYNEIHATFEATGQASGTVAGSLGELITIFKNSRDYTALKPRVQELYLGALDYLQTHFGHLAAAGITRRIFRELQDDLAKTPAKANNFLSVSSRLYAFGIDRNILQVNPVAKIKKIKIGEWRPWSAEEIAAFNASAAPAMKLALCLALYTGQRLGDVIKMRWNQISEGGIEVTQQKTGAKIWIPLHSRLRAIIEETKTRRLLENKKLESAGKPKLPDSVMILNTQVGKPFKTDHLKHQFKAACRTAGLPEDCVFHGLRKTAAVMLAEAGCSNEQIKSITGHRTDQMVSHYTKGAQQKVLARAAIERLEFVNPSGQPSKAADNGGR